MAKKNGGAKSMKGIILSHRAYSALYSQKMLRQSLKKGVALSKTARIKTGFRKTTRTLGNNSMKDLNATTSIQNTRIGGGYPILWGRFTKKDGER